MTATVISLAQVRVMRNCRQILEANQRTLAHVDDLRRAHHSLAESLGSVRDGLESFHDSLDDSLARLRASGLAQQKIMERIERIQASSSAFR